MKCPQCDIEQTRELDGVNWQCGSCGLTTLVYVKPQPLYENIPEYQNKENRMNINNLNPANIALFKSRKFWLAIIGIVVDVVIALIPELEAVRAELILVNSAMIAVVINGYAQEDRIIAEKTGERNAKYVR